MSEPSRRAAGAVGRKRDPLIEPRVFDAALRVYAHGGWSGFTFEGIARAAGVGKPAIYRRWSSREELLIAALQTADFPEARDCGHVRADLLDERALVVEQNEIIAVPRRVLKALRASVAFSYTRLLTAPFYVCI